MRDRWSWLARLLSRKLSGTVRVDGETGSWVAGRGEPVVDVTVHDARTFRSIVRRQSIGLGESYVEGWWDADDLTGVVRLLLRSTARPRALLDRAAQLISRPLSGVRRRRAPDRVTDRRNVRAHYDLPPELFTAMLDETMAYSCGIFESLAPRSKTHSERSSSGSARSSSSAPTITWSRSARAGVVLPAMPPLPTDAV